MVPTFVRQRFQFALVRGTALYQAVHCDATGHLLVVRRPGLHRGPCRGGARCDARTGKIRPPQFSFRSDGCMETPVLNRIAVTAPIHLRTELLGERVASGESPSQNFTKLS